MTTEEQDQHDGIVFIVHNELEDKGLNAFLLSKEELYKRYYEKALELLAKGNRE